MTILIISDVEKLVIHDQLCRRTSKRNRKNVKVPNKYEETYGILKKNIEKFKKWKIKQYSHGEKENK